MTTAISVSRACTGRLACTSRSAAPFRRPRPARSPLAVRASTDNGGDDLDRQLKEDLERMRQRAAATAPSSAEPRFSQTPQASGDASSGSGIKEIVDKILIADFFFILFALGWLGVGLAVNTAGSSGLLDTWFLLWQWVFQPAIGVLMLGALVSGATGWAKDNLGGGK